VQKDSRSLREALRNRGGASSAEVSLGKAVPDRGAKKNTAHSKVFRDVSRGRTASAGISRDRRPSWAPNAAVLVDGAAEQFSRFVEAVRGVGTEWPSSAPEPQPDGERREQSLQHRLNEWFAHWHWRYDGRLPPRQTSKLTEVRSGDDGHRRLQTTMVWRGCEIHLEMTTVSTCSVPVVTAARSEVVGFHDQLQTAVCMSKGHPVEALCDALLDVEDNICEDENPEEVPSFSTWVSERPPNLRFGKWESKAWDFPLSREEKTELLILQLLNVQQPDFSSDPAPAEVTPGHPSRRWSYASSARSG